MRFHQSAGFIDYGKIQGCDMAIHSNIVHSSISFLRSFNAFLYLSLGIPMVSFSHYASHPYLDKSGKGRRYELIVYAPEISAECYPQLQV